MRILSIDTSSLFGSIALSEGVRPVVQQQQWVSSTHSERLIATIDNLLAVAKWKRDDIEGVAIAAGPGSFTGLRIGLSTAKGIAFAVGCPIAGASSLEALLVSAGQRGDVIVPVLDARRGELYASASLRSDDGSFATLIDECVLPPNILIEKLKGLKKPLYLVGDGVPAYRNELRTGLGKIAILADDQNCCTQAANLAILLADRLAKGGDDIDGLSPNYIRRSDAEIGFMGKRSKK